MFIRTLATTALFALAMGASAQMAGAPPQSTPTAPAQGSPTQAAPATPAKHKAPKPAAEEAPGGGPDKVWVNTNSSVYHCPGDRFYGTTAHGRYMTEAAAKSAGAHGVGGKTCSVTAK